MKILVTRQACCSQDDQIGPLEAVFDVPDSCPLDALLEAVAASGFLQFSSSHTEMGCLIDGTRVARVAPAPNDAAPGMTCTLSATASAAVLAADTAVTFVFDRI